MKKCLVFATFFLLFAALSAFGNYCANTRADVQDYINTLVKKYHFERGKLDQLFCTATINEEVMQRMSKPAEAKPWYQYYALLVTPERINKGLAYWRSHEKILTMAEQKYGVPASIIVAIIGIETKYGENKGTFPVFNTLVNLAFNHGRRAAFFRSELTEYLLLARENKLKPLLLKGSYAGAVGLPQFMPSSYRNYAVDFNQKGWADLFNNDADAIASVANYLKKHGWHSGEPVAIPASVRGNSYLTLQTKKFKPYLTEWDLERYNVFPASPVHSKKVCFLRLEGKDHDEYWLGFQNFYAITTYNNSELYVMAVNFLAQKMEEQKHPHKEKQVALIEPEIEINDNSVSQPTDERSF